VSAPAWLTARPIAHRGLHARDTGIVENTLSAAQAAIERGFSIECDVQLSADGEAVVFHDSTLERLTANRGSIAKKTVAGLALLALKGTDDRIATFPAFVATIAGRVPLIVEIKSHYDGDWRLAERCAAVIAEYQGPVALKSFDPQVIAHLRDNADRLGSNRYPLGIVAQARYGDKEWQRLPQAFCENLAAFLHYPQTRPDFLSWQVDDLPHAVPFLLRSQLDTPVITWTVRREEQRALATKWADQIVFEGFAP
jgi:glycerophosphoryl diester phosphodiesterase